MSRGQFVSPEGIAIDNQGNVYVTDTGNDRIEKFDSSGNYLGQWDSSGSASDPNGLDHPSGLAIDQFGNVLVSDGGNDVIKRFPPAGIYEGTMPHVAAPPDTPTLTAARLIR